MRSTGLDCGHTCIGTDFIFTPYFIPMATRWNLRGTTLFKAFLLNALAAALISTAIVEIRLALNAKRKRSSHSKVI